jgi:hypothetical protein
MAGCRRAHFFKTYIKKYQSRGASSGRVDKRRGITGGGSSGGGNNNAGGDGGGGGGGGGDASGGGGGGGGGGESSEASAALRPLDPSRTPALLDPALLLDRTRSFEVFRKSYRRNEAIEANKTTLKDKVRKPCLVLFTFFIFISRRHFC